MNAGAGLLPDGYRLIALDEVTSTNQVALDRIQSGDAADGDVIFSPVQTAGRGRQSRPWESQKGNLFMSLVVRHDGPLDTAAQLSFVAALAVRESVSSLANAPHAPQVTCKWPNDVLIDGEKVAGILLEVGHHPAGDDSAWIVVGIGINLASPPAEARYPATCIKDTYGTIVLPRPMMGTVCAQFASFRTKWQTRGFSPVREQWLASAYGLGETIHVRNGNHETLGTFTGIDDRGTLILHTDTGSLAISAGDVHFPAAL